MSFLLLSGGIVLSIVSFLLIRNHYQLKLTQKQLSLLELHLVDEQQRRQVVVTELGDLKEKLSQQLLFDALTGLPSRQVFEDRLAQVLNQSQRHQLTFAIMFLDIDEFKIINDALGHDVGDELLKAVAERLATCIRQLDTLSRFSGDHFVLLLPQLGKTETASYIAQRLVEAVSQPFSVQGQELFITASIGIATYPIDGEDSRMLLRNADNALNQAQEHGHNGYQFYQRDMQTHSRRELILSSSLKNPDIYKQFSIVYQPQIYVETKKIIGVDAQLRWVHPELGLIHEDEFARLQETNRYSLAVDEWAFRNALAQFKQWNEQGMQLQSVSINISWRQLESSHFIYKISQILQELHLAPECLVLAVAEDSLLTKLPAVEKSLSMLKHMGVKIAIAHFGAGHLSLQHLKKLPINYLKIDRSLISDVTTNPESTAIVKMILAIAKSLQIIVIPEGVVQEEQKSLLKELGCDTMQGSYFGEAFSAAAVEKDNVL